jgi:O-antigen ligase
VSRRPQARFERLAAWPLVCAFVFSIPWEKSLFVPAVGTISRLLGVLAVTAGVVAAIRRKSIRPPNLALLVAAVFVVWTALTYFWSVAPADTVERVKTFAQLLAMLWLVWDCCRTHGQQLGLMQAYVAGASVASVMTMIRYAQGHQTYYLRYAAAGFDPNDLGLTVVLSIPLALYLALRGRGWRRWAYRAAVALAIEAVLLAASRTALVACLAAFGFALWTWREADGSQKISSVILLCFLIVGALYLAPSASRRRLATLPFELMNGTLNSRTRIWKAGVEVVLSHPVCGVGAGAFPEAARPWLRMQGLAGRYVAHNTYLSVLAEEGLVGFGLCALLLAALAVYAWIMPPAERALWVVTLAVWAVGVMTMSWEHRKPVWLFCGLIMTEWARSFRRVGDGREDTRS